MPLERKEKLVRVTHGFLSEFKNFAVKGNALELAIAVIVGNAFGKIVSSLVGDIITPLLALASGGADFKNLSLVLREAGTNASGALVPAVVLSYGVFFQTVIDFFFIALSVFLVFKLLSTTRRKLFRQGEKAVPAYEKPAQERLLEEIRDLLKSRAFERPAQASEESK
jgi:large conductance mechanosensitive channel